MSFAAEVAERCRRVWPETVDRVMGQILLRHFFWYRNHPAAIGDTARTFPDLLSGDLARVFAPIPEALDLATHHAAFIERPWGVAEDLRFASLIESPHPENNVVWCRRWRPAHEDRGLVVVGCDGIVQVGCRWFTRLSQQLTPAGIGVVMMDSAYNFRRVPAGFRSGQLIVHGDLDHQLSVARQSVLDLWQVIRSLQAEGKRVGLVGCSYGGWLTLMASLLAADLEFAIALAPPVDIAALLESRSPFVHAVQRGLQASPHLIDRWETASRAVRLPLWTPQLPGSAITLHLAEYDRFVPTESIAQLAETWGTQLIRHRDAHYRITSRAEVRQQVAAEILQKWRHV